MYLYTQWRTSIIMEKYWNITRFLIDKKISVFITNKIQTGAYAVLPCLYTSYFMKDLQFLT